MRTRRTDLAMEARELWQESAGEMTALSGVEARDECRDGIPVNTVRILDQEGERALGKPRGTYVTLTVEGLAARREDIFRRAVRAVAGALWELGRELPPRGLILVVGLGNRDITPDAVGPKVHDQMLVTRHLLRQMPEQFGGLRPVASVAAEVLGTTGVESGELVRAVCDAIRPAGVVAVDALASRSLKRLCSTIQLSDTGITPGSGVGNHRMGLNRESLGVPVLAVGGAHGGGRGHPGRRPAGGGGVAAPGGGEGASGDPQGYRQPGERPGQSDRLRDQSGPSAGADPGGAGAVAGLGEAGIGGRKPGRL